MRTEYRQKFVKLANRRVSSALKQIQLIGNLANRSSYDYTEEDVSKIFKALNSELNACNKRFDTASQGNGNVQFSLDD